MYIFVTLLAIGIVLYCLWAYIVWENEISEIYIYIEYIVNNNYPKLFNI